MFEAQYLYRGSSDFAVFSPWFPRKGDNARFSIEILAVNSATFTVKLWTKNTEDAGNGTDIQDLLTAQDTVQRYTAENVGEMEEMVRYQFIVNGDAASDFILFRTLPISWFDTVKP